VLLEGSLDASLPELDLSIARAPLRWVLGQPISVGAEAAGALLVGGVEPLAELLSDRVRDGARQLAVDYKTHGRMTASEKRASCSRNKVKRSSVRTR